MGNRMVDIVEVFVNMFQNIIYALPAIVAAIIILVIGYLIGSVVGKTVNKLVERLGMEKAFDQSMVGKNSGHLVWTCRISSAEWSRHS